MKPKLTWVKDFKKKKKKKGFGQVPHYVRAELTDHFYANAKDLMQIRRIEIRVASLSFVSINMIQELKLF